MRTLAELSRSLSEKDRPGPRLILVTDVTRQGDLVRLAGRLPAGSLVLLRDYDHTERNSLARRLADLCRARRLRLLIGADFRLAVALGAGLHLPEGLARSVPAKIRLWHRHPASWLTCAAHDRRGLVRAKTQRADAALLSPVFPTASHPGGTSLGPLRFRALARRTSLPLYALGGVTAATILRLKGSQAMGIAAIGGWSHLKSDPHPDHRVNSVVEQIAVGESVVDMGVHGTAIDIQMLVEGVIREN
jgi:thiamine-phosphate pyrophosphorylase